MIEYLDIGGARVRRFEPVVRALHWTTASLLLVTLATGAILYFGSLAAQVGRRVLVEDIHVWSGVLSPLPLLLSYAGPWRAPVRRDVRRLARWSDADVRWLRTFGRRARETTGKFNAGQKANAVFVAGSMAVMIMTGAVMRWFTLFPLDWRTGATFVHDWFAIAMWIIVADHIVKALSEPIALRAMTSGWMPLEWAERAHPVWAAELESVRRTGADPHP